MSLGHTSGRQNRGITGARAVVFMGIMLLTCIAGAAITDNPKASEHLFGASFFLAAAAWGLSNLFPVGWFTMTRTVLLAVVLFGGLLGVILLAAKH